jgi:membrane-bound serine protease (ClpP class)
MRPLLTAFFLGLSAFSPASAEPPKVLLAPYSGIITPIASEFMREAVARAEAESFDAVVLQLDTPGGLDLSMREIVKSVFAARVPVIVYVHPAGGRAASAGVFITMAAHVAAMTPGTNIGAAHPVSLPTMGGAGKESKSDDKVMEGKMVNDAAAYLKSIARKRGRNEDWAFEAVTKSTSIAAADALGLGVVDVLAESVSSLLEKIDGKTLTDFDAPLRTKGAQIVRQEMTRRQRWLAAIVNPNVAMILMSLGAGGIFIELYNPGLILPGVVGVLCLILAFYAFETLSVSYAGMLLIASGVAFLLLEIKIASYGLLALGAIAAVALGVLMLFQQSLGGVSVSWGVLFGSLASLIALFAGVSAVAYRAMGKRAMTGPEGMIGLWGEVLSELDPAGRINIHGEIWDAESVSGKIEKGGSVVVEGCRGLTLRVRAASRTNA